MSIAKESVWYFVASNDDENDEKEIMPGETA
jgi:hypothetical protein